MPEKTTLSLDELRESLKEAFAVIDRLAPYIHATVDMAEVIENALTSDSQLRFLHSLITSPPKK